MMDGETTGGGAAVGKAGLSKRLGIEHPIIQAPMAGGPTTAELVAAVSNAGGLGSLGAAYLTPDQIAEDSCRLARQHVQTGFGRPGLEREMTLP
jgi:nitronate monooxygenase